MSLYKDKSNAEELMSIKGMTYNMEDGKVVKTKLEKQDIIKDNENDDWNFGCAVMASTGYEIYKKNNFALNVQSKLVMGRAFLAGDAHRDAVSLNIGLGFSWF